MLHFYGRQMLMGILYLYIIYIYDLFIMNGRQKTYLDCLWHTPKWWQKKTAVRSSSCLQQFQIFFSSCLKGDTNHCPVNLTFYWCLFFMFSNTHYVADLFILFSNGHTLHSTYNIQWSVKLLYCPFVIFKCFPCCRYVSFITCF